MATPPNTVRICFTIGDTIHVISLADVETMSAADIKNYKRGVVNHVCETFDPAECDAGNRILDAMDKRLKDIAEPKHKD